MKNILYIVVMMILSMGTSCSRQPKEDCATDTGIIVYGTRQYYLPLDTFMMLLSKDSLVYVRDSAENRKMEETDYWCTKDFYMWNYVFPDTITVAFTRDGVFEDSVKCERKGSLEDSCGRTYSPAYVFTSATGDCWVYDINGKFIDFGCSPYPHSGKPHHYNP